jgi:hypothetical protein
VLLNPLQIENFNLIVGMLLLNPLQIKKGGWNETSQFSLTPLQKFKIASAF